MTSNSEKDYITKKESNRRFVNRNNPLAILKYCYDDLLLGMQVEKRMSTSSNVFNYNVIDYYGIGGKGKSSLIHKLINQHNKDFIIWDIDRQRRHGIVEVLTYFRDKLVRNHGFKFEEFDKHISVYFIDENLNLTDYEEAKYSKVGTDLIKDLGKTFLDNITFGYAGTIFNALENTKKMREKQNQSKTFQQLEQLEALEVWEQIRVIKKVFEYEYNLNMSKRDQPMIIYVDTFELYNLETKWLFTGIDSVKFSYGLCHSLEHTLWVFAGRDSVDLKAKDKWDAEKYKKIQLENFNEETSTFFLTKIIQISDENVIQKILNETQGDPLLLNLYGNMYQDYLRTDSSSSNESFLKQFEDLSNQDVYTRLSIRYLRYLEEGVNRNGAERQGDLLRKLACIGSWRLDESDLLQASLFLNQKNIREQLKEINQKSLVNASLDDEDREVFSMDRTVQETLLKGEIDGEALIEASIKEESLSYLIRKSKEISLRSKEIDQIIRLTFLLNEDAREEYIYNQVLLNLENQFKLFMEKKNIRSLMNVRFQVLNYFEEDFFHNDFGQKVFIQIVLELLQFNLFDYNEQLKKILPKVPLTKTVCLSMAQYIFFVGDFDKAIDYYLLAISALPETEEQLSDQDTAIVIGYIGTLILNSQFDQIESFAHEVEMRLPYNQDTFFELAFYNIMYSYYSKRSLSDETKMYYDALRTAYAHADFLTEDQRLYIEGELVSIYAFSGEESKAIVAGEAFIEKMKRFKGINGRELNRDKIYNSISNAWRKLGNFDEAIRYLKELVNWREEHLGESHYRTIQSYNNIGFNYLDRYLNSRRHLISEPEYFEESEKYLSKAHELANQHLGKTHYLTAMILSTLSRISLLKGDWEESVERAEESYKIKVNLYPEGSSQLLDGKQTLYTNQSYLYAQDEVDITKLREVKQDLQNLLEERVETGWINQEDVNSIQTSLRKINAAISNASRK